MLQEFESRANFMLKNLIEYSDHALQKKILCYFSLGNVMGLGKIYDCAKKLNFSDEEIEDYCLSKLKEFISHEEIDDNIAQLQEKVLEKLEFCVENFLTECSSEITEEQAQFVRQDPKL